MLTPRRVDASPPVARAHQSREINCAQVQGNKFGNDQTPPVEGAASGWWWWRQSRQTAPAKVGARGACVTNIETRQGVRTTITCQPRDRATFLCLHTHTRRLQTPMTTIRLYSVTPPLLLLVQSINLLQFDVLVEPTRIWRWQLLSPLGWPWWIAQRGTRYTQRPNVHS